MICTKCGRETNSNHSLCTMCAAGAPISYKSSPGFPSPTSALTGTAPTSSNVNAAPPQKQGRTDEYYKNTEVVMPKKTSVPSDPSKINYYADMGLLLAFFMPFAGVALSILGLLKSDYLGNKYTALYGLIIGIVLSIAVVVVLLLGNVSIHIKF